MDGDLKYLDNMGSDLGSLVDRLLPGTSKRFSKMMDTRYEKKPPFEKPNFDDKRQQENHVLHDWLPRFRFRAFALPFIVPVISNWLATAPQMTAHLLLSKNYA